MRYFELAGRTSPASRLISISPSPNDSERRYFQMRARASAHARAMFTRGFFVLPPSAMQPQRIRATTVEGHRAVRDQEVARMQAATPGSNGLARKLMPRSVDLVSGLSQRPDGRFEVGLEHQHIVRVVCADGENRDLGFRKRKRQRHENPDELRCERPIDA